MEKIKILINKKEYLVDIADTEESREKGLQNTKELPENEGMLFIFDDSDEVGMWMKDTLIPLDVIFIDENFKVINIHQGVPESEKAMIEQNVSMVLEVNINSGVTKDMEIEFSPNVKIKEGMQVLNEDGSTQMELVGGERIFSRANTKILIKFAKKANITKKDSDYKALGKRAFKFLDIQESNDDEYVE